MPRATLTIALLLTALMTRAAGATGTPPPFPKSEEERKAFAETVCTEIDARAGDPMTP